MFDVRETLIEIERRDLDREGIQMILELRGAAPAPAGDPRRVDGCRLAGMLAVVHAELALRPEKVTVIDGVPTDDHVPAEAVSQEERLLAEALSVLAYSDFGPGTSAHPPGPVASAEPPVDRRDLAGPLRPQPGTRLETAVQALEEGRFVRVVNYHNTPASAANRLRSELREYARRFASVGMEDLDGLFVTGDWPHDRPPILPVFYEGYRNNAEVAAPICEEVDLAGWFFVVTGFLDAPVAEQQAYAEAHFIILVPEELDRGRIAMTWDQLAELGRRHVVNAHTTNHRALAAVRTPEDFLHEIVEPHDRVRQATGVPAPGHAWLFGTGFGVSPEHDVALRNAGYQWCFSNTAIDATHPVSSRPG